MTSENFSREQLRRYNRHLILDGFGEQGQRRLLNSRVLIVGAGGLGSPIALYLAAAGIGTIGIADGDDVSLTNLQRQIIHCTGDIGKPKVDSAERRINELNPDVKVEKHAFYLNEDNALDLIRDYDFVVEGSDNFSAKYLVNDACVMLDKPFCIGGINRYSGQVMTHKSGTACYRCLFPEPPAQENVETCAMVGVLGSIAGMLGTVQATEVIKHLAGIGEPLYNSMLSFDALTMQWSRFRFDKDNNCNVCGDKPSITELKEYAFQPCKNNR